MGVYPLMPNETCHFLAFDFDKEIWREDVLAFMDTCRLEEIPASLERSRSGNGTHVWIFFVKPITAVKARKLGSFLMTRTLDRRPEIGLDSFDRFFPNQDTMPKGGFGNLIAIPLQKTAREKNHRQSIDARFTGELRDDQQKAFQKLMASQTGILSASAAFGKTVVAIRMIAERRVNTLILVHRKLLADQWAERINQFLGISEKDNRLVRQPINMIKRENGTGKKELSRSNINF
jgi:hypothetical protein